MKRIITTVFLLFTFYLPLTCHAQLEEPYPGGDECTIGVASGKATMDGRPLLWKSRDYASEPDNEVVYNMSSVNRYIAVTNAGETYVWMGVNDKGFSIVNSLCNDLQKAPYGPSNGQLMYDALSTCNSVDDFEQMLIITNESGRQTGANFAVIDASGAAAVFETAGYEYWKFDACDSVTAPDGYLLRTNFAFMGDGKNGIRDGLYSVERYRRQQQLIDNFHTGDTLNAKSIFRTQMRDFSDFDSQPVGVPFPYKWLSNRPYGYIYCGVSICRSTTVSAAVIQGVLPEESPKLSTMWTMLGQPASSITVPYWPAGRTPFYANGNPRSALCDESREIRSLLFDYPANGNYINSYKLRNANGDGLWKMLFAAEDSIFTAANDLIQTWREDTMLTADVVNAEKDLATYALTILRKAYRSLTSTVVAESTPHAPSSYTLRQNYPNPFNPETFIQFALPSRQHVTLTLYNCKGEFVDRLLDQELGSGEHAYRLDGSNLSSGIYFYRLAAYSSGRDDAPGFNDIRKCVLVK